MITAIRVENSSGFDKRGSSSSSTSSRFRQRLRGQVDAHMVCDRPPHNLSGVQRVSPKVRSFVTSVCRMPRLIHLNGASGIGKSTIARMYADRHPGVLNLDTDHVVSLVGGWQDNFWTALVAARELAVSMAATHLQSGHDVVMPQLVTRITEIEDFEVAAKTSDAEYLEVVLIGSKEQALARFAERSTHLEITHQQQLDQVIVQNGGDGLLERIHDHLTQYLRIRSNYLVIDADRSTAEGTYESLIAALAALAALAAS
ncbi:MULTISPECIES: AAA family ATPase [Rhodococcus]|uniref:AAA family ATPase n=2 Tax=Rhodococcus TaxID=1827 RepID=A0AB38RMM9_RHOSG|nr:MULTISPECIES: AAA family ATPase [Rhodococcus]UPU46628.1 AAA family ATPase [Rhodococcus qingshengii JCM 15477]